MIKLKELKQTIQNIRNKIETQQCTINDYQRNHCQCTYARKYIEIKTIHSDLKLWQLEIKLRVNMV